MTLKLMFLADVIHENGKMDTAFHIRQNGEGQQMQNFEHMLYSKIIFKLISPKYLFTWRFH